MVVALILFVLGLACGSFVNALVWRLHEQAKGKATKAKADLSILRGRSQCPECGHRLSALDLVPLLSWLMLRGKCRYCKKPISAQYPIVELLAALTFAGSYVFWPQVVHLNGQWLLLYTWLVASVGLLALAVYDLRWMLLPSRILYPTLLVAAAGRLAYILAYQPHRAHAFVLWLGSLAVASGVFWLLFTVSQGKWIGFGDVRLGLITGTLLADPAKALAMIFIASLIGSLAVVPSLSKGQKTLASRLPYGPFLISSTALLVVFGDQLIDWYKSLVL